MPIRRKYKRNLTIFTIYDLKNENLITINIIMWEQINISAGYSEDIIEYLFEW